MGAKPITKKDGALETTFGAGLKRTLLGFLTLGTSEIQTGAGQYGDETLADSLFPKEINNLMLDDREAARKVIDADKAEAVKKAQPGPVPDLADKLLQRAGSDSLLRQKAKSGRKSTFLSGSYK